jgi:hypothetical protein
MRSDHREQAKGRIWWFGASTAEALNFAPKNVQFECDAHWPFKGTHVRQDI